jgi:hypothetical protein
MRTIFGLCGALLLAGAFLLWRSLREPGVYGSFIGAPHADVTDLVERPEDFLGKAVSVEGKISEQCKTMGCFFFFRSGGTTLRVELQAIAMKAPMREGRTARVEGQIMRYAGGYQLVASAVEFK